MTPVDTFLRSVRGAFQPGNGISPWSWAAVALSVPLLALSSRWWNRRVRERAAEAAFAARLVERRLSAADGRLLRRLAQRAQVSPLSVATRLEVFERATALELSGQPPTTTSALPDAGGQDPTADVLAAISRLRHGLGFQVIPEHVPLLTTRELVPGTRVEVAGIAGEVLEVNEAWFAVGAAPDLTFVLGRPDLPVQIAFARDGRYVARCALVAAEPPAVPRRLLLGHDERPERRQLRAAVRVAVRGTVHLSYPRAPGADGGRIEPRGQASAAADGSLPNGSLPNGSLPNGSLPNGSLPNGSLPNGSLPNGSLPNGSLIDISLGGVALQGPVAFPIGASLHVTIEWNGEVYRGLPAAVLRCEPGAAGTFLVGLAFRGLPDAEASRLSAAVARQSARQPDDRPSEKPRGEQ